ncbi:MAG: LuxR C-terminal-related transcriptional regulator [Alphaproteobacteria bacterium]|nr:LuxR C-terminal-related transcriptional regulator [Alphaproteobacteria bacterium]
MRESELLDLIYGVLADAGQWPHVLTAVSDYLGAVGGIVTYAGPDGRGFMTSGRLDDSLQELYLKHYLWNAWSTAMKEAPPGQVVFGTSHFDHRVLRRSAFFADILAPQGIADAMGSSHPALAVGGGVGGFGFMLSERGRDKVGEKARRFQRLLPHLGRALDASLEIGRYAHHSAQFEVILQTMPQAAFLLDAQGRILFANTPAHALLQSGDGLCYHDSRLTASLPAQRRALTGYINAALDAAHGTAATLLEPLRLKRPSESPELIVMPVPLPPAAFPLWELNDRAQLLLSVLDPVLQRLAAADMVQKTFGLTPAQARVAVLIGAGLSGPQTAASLGLSLPTVKAHLARSFEKIGVNSQAALVRLFTSLPAEPPSEPSAAPQPP